MHTTSTVLGVAAGAIAAMFSGCADRMSGGPAAPIAAAVGAPDVSRGPIPNAIRYRDRGFRPTSARSGEASITASALIGPDGVTDIELRADGERSTLAMALIRAYAPGGTHLITSQYKPDAASTVIRLSGLTRHSRLRERTLLRTATSPRATPIDLEQIAVLRPDVALTDLQAPPEVWTQAPTVVSATIRETNGDVGARATCLLELDGAPLDSAVGIWVDAGGTVSCTFAPSLTQVGTHTLTVRAAAVAPGDWDLANNAVSTSITIGREIPMSFQAIAVDDSVPQWRRWFRDFTTGGGYPEQAADSSGTSGRTQRATLTAYTREPLTFPEEPLTDVRLSQWTGSTQVHEATYATLPADKCPGDSGLELRVCRALGRRGRRDLHPVLPARHWRWGARELHVTDVPMERRRRDLPLEGILDPRVHSTQPRVRPVLLLVE